MTMDEINHPKHYASIFKTKETECRTIIRLLGFDPGCFIKYIWRAGNKGSAASDINKALNYLSDWMELQLTLGIDVGKWDIARVLFHQLEVPEDKKSVDAVKWQIIDMALNPSDFSDPDIGFFEIRNAVLDLAGMLGVATEDIDVPSF